MTTDKGFGQMRTVLRVALLVLVGVVLAAPVSASASGLPEVEVGHMAEIEEWVYRNAAMKDPEACGGVCQSLWRAQHEAMPETATTQEFWDELGALFTERTHLWGSLEEFSRQLGGKFIIGPSPFRVGWHVGSGEGSKYIEVLGPGAPPLAPGCSVWEIMFRVRGEQLATSFFERGFAPGNEWYLNLCASSLEIVGQLAKAENPLEPGANCGDNGYEILGWVKQEWWWNACSEGSFEGKEVLAKIFAQAFYQQFHFGRPQDWTGQKAEGEFSHNIQTGGVTDPGATAVKEALEKILEESTAARKWVQWAVEGQAGANPLGTFATEGYGETNASAPKSKACFTGKPVNCATGNEVLAQTDLTVGGRGPGLQLTRTYNAQLAAEQESPGIFGHGWTGSYSARVVLSEEQKRATVYQDDGSTVGFTRSSEQWVAANPLIQATLASEANGYLYTLSNQTVLHFNTSGVLTSEVDRNGNALSMNRNAEGRLESISDPSGRKLTFAYNSEGLVESVTDPMGHVVKYAYEAKNLTTVTLPGETAPNWQFKYDTQHRLTSMTDGRGGKTTTEYDGQNRVSTQTDPLGHILKFEYEPSRTKVTNQATGAVTVESFSADNELVSITQGYGTSSVTTSEFAYDKAGNLASASDGNKHTTTYEYDSAGNETKMVDPESRETKWTYNSTHDVASMTRPNGETTTITRDEHGNPTLISRPAPGSTTQETHFEYNPHGQPTSMSNPLGRKWTYEYDNQGDAPAKPIPKATSARGRTTKTPRKPPRSARVATSRAANHPSTRRRPNATPKDAR